MNTVTLTDLHVLTCSCGAKSKDTAEGRQRFMRRHPALCSDRKEFARQLAQTTRAVEDEERQERRWTSDRK